ncbi:MAG: homocysteine S-methyltransferase family protein [Candidatus Omnitrophica bacterium]|nr:homocysteine S-methyltransferase family protein [Candidatus Omnitrophota bacterium]
MRKKTLREKLERDLVLLDGAFGTYAEFLGLSNENFKDNPGCMEYLSVASPDFIRKIHNDYLESGSDAVETNSFGANVIKLAEYGLAKKVYELNLSAAKIARSAADQFSSETHLKYVVGAMGPTGKLPSSTDPVLGNITTSELVKVFYEQAIGLIDGGVDALLVETGQDVLEMKCAVIGIKEAIKERRRDIVIMTESTLSNNGRMLLGTEISVCMTVFAYMGVDVIGINCSTGPVEMERTIANLSKNCPTFFSAVPNAGLPIESAGKTIYPLSPSEMARILSGFVNKYSLDVIGGCCGTTPAHIKAIRETLGKCKKRKRPGNRHYASFYKSFDLKEIKRPLKIGERINTQGSKHTKDLLKAENYDGIVELGKLEEKQGAGILDVCSVLTERRTEKKDSLVITKRLSESVEIPLMIDSTDYAVIESSVENYPGTAFINSVNLEDGGEKARKVYALSKKHGSFVVNLAIDERGMAKTFERKIDIAKRLYDIAVNEYKLESHRLLFDLLTFTLGTGEKEYADAAINTFSAIRMFKKLFPETLTVLGVSNISFGLQKEARKIINMVFLYHAVKAGLDTAIVNPSEYIEYKDIDKKECKLAEDLIFNSRQDALERIIEHFSNKKPLGKDASNAKVQKMFGIKETLQNCIFERDKIKVTEFVDKALEKYSPQEIINDILIDAMKTVGEKLDSGEMVLPYVLQSAEVMRKAMEHLNKFFPHDASKQKGTVLLATVFGDVHDIGKNLVKMILQNNGFSVIDLGKQVSVARIIEEAKRNKVDVIGLSALLVSTARYMKECVNEMHKGGLNFPLIIGGAPINERFAGEISYVNGENLYVGGVFYAKDAFKGLSLVQSLTNAEKKKEILELYHKGIE